MTDIDIQDMSNDKVRCSRAGDMFHYRWAARRCLQMIHPASNIKCIVIEGSKESELSGEYVMDISEYHNEPDKTINYYQLKHTTVCKDVPFNLSDLKVTIEGFANRYRELKESQSDAVANFFIVTNRIIADIFKDGVLNITSPEKCNTRFLGTLKKYTKLADLELIDFCNHLKLIDGLGDYNDQLLNLYDEYRSIGISNTGSTQIDTITALISQKALPDSDGCIYPEEILRKFGHSSKRDLFPAPNEIEILDSPIQRECYTTLMEDIFNTTVPIIVHAAGGTGKSIFSKFLEQKSLKDSATVVYDCFGGGKYRNRTQSRHKHNIGLVQIINELALKGLCDPLIAQDNFSNDKILRNFIQNLNIACENILQLSSDAKIIIVIDAADNAEMAASEYNEECFVHELLKENIPTNCRLVLLCRTERISLLQAPSIVIKKELPVFNYDETFLYLKRIFKDITSEECEEFLRLTFGNPRVQSYALANNSHNIKKLLESLGLNGVTIEKQIENQLEQAICRIKDNLPNIYQNQIDAICYGLACLPPFIPISVLALISDVEADTIKSFVSDFGKALWISDTVIQFRDEPTETWFRNTYFATRDQARCYIDKIKQLGEKNTYISEVLPILYMKAEYYNELIDLTLNEQYLPEDTVDRRNIQAFRLEFALKAALKLDRYLDASKLALLIGEESASNKRQEEIFKANIDLIEPLQSFEKVQELAYKKVLSGRWNGSENIYSASLLSNISHLKGEAYTYLRAAENWLKIYFKEREEDSFEKLNTDEIIEFAFTYYNLYGIKRASDFILSWQPNSLIYDITCGLTKRFIDLGKNTVIDEMASLCQENIYAILAICNEQFKNGQYINQSVLDNCLSLIDIKTLHISNSTINRAESSILEALISFIEECSLFNLHIDKLILLINNFLPIRASLNFNSNYKTTERKLFLRACALRMYLFKINHLNEDNWLPEKYDVINLSVKQHQEIDSYKQIFDILMPWYNLRLKVILENQNNIEQAVTELMAGTHTKLQHRYGEYDNVPFEISSIYIDILAFATNISDVDINKLYYLCIEKNRYISIPIKLRALKIAYKLNHLQCIRNQLEENVYSYIKNINDSPETKASYYIALARATLLVNKDDASEYFNMAIAEVSRFGDELPEWWKAISAIATCITTVKNENAELAYRFIRSAEITGDNVIREKYWDRHEAVYLCTKLSPAIGLATLSRWNDRQVWPIDDLLPSLIKAVIENEYISPEAIWSLAAFVDIDDLIDIAILCMKRISDSQKLNHFLDLLINQLKVFGVSLMAWNKLKTFLSSINIPRSDLDSICNELELLSPSTENSLDLSTNKHIPNDEIIDEKILNLLSQLDLTQLSNINSLFNEINISNNYLYNKSKFWDIFFSKIPTNKAIECINTLIYSANITFYDLKEALKYIPSFWKRKPSFDRAWFSIIIKIGCVYSKWLINNEQYTSFINTLDFNTEEQEMLNKGIFEGLSETNSICKLNNPFEIAEMLLNKLTSIEAEKLLDFALKRFEFSIDDDYGDGKWSTRFIPNTSPEYNLSGFIWTLLASPECEMRWKAVHAVKLLAQLNCTNEINALLKWAEAGNSGYFSSTYYPFYKLNAELYLLIALERISLEYPQILLKHKDLFFNYIDTPYPHALLLKKASNILKNINTVLKENIVEENSLDSKLVSPFPLQIIPSDQEVHRNIECLKDIQQPIKIIHDYDFKRYWIEPLADIFGVSAEEITKYISFIITEHFKIKLNDNYIKDPRSKMWQYTRKQEKTYYRYEQHPCIESYEFYLTYHSLFIIAQQLLMTLPVIFKNSFNEEILDINNPWNSWIKSHDLIRTDGFLLADCRTPYPYRTVSWNPINNVDNWKRHIEDSYFLRELLLNNDYLCVNGYFEKGEWHYREEFSISSALVAPETTNSLIAALTTCKEPQKLPWYNEEGMEFDKMPFILKGWISSEDTSSGLDSLDLWAGDIHYPSYEIGAPYQKLLNLKSNRLKTEWYIDHSVTNKIVSENWSHKLHNLYGKEDILYGQRISAPITCLSTLCKKTQMNILFLVKIYRRIVDDDHTKTLSNNTYIPAFHKIYVLSEEGVLKDESGNIIIR